jgi:hypothetical protein
MRRPSTSVVAEELFNMPMEKGFPTADKKISGLV